MALLTLTLGIMCVRCPRVPSYHEQQICVNYSTNCFGKSKSFRKKFENQCSLQFSHYVKGCGTEQTTIAMLFRLDIQESFCKDNAKFKFLGITWESGFLQGSTDFIFQTFRELKIQNPKSKILPWCHLQDILAPLYTQCFELFRVWNYAVLLLVLLQQGQNQDETSSYVITKDHYSLGGFVFLFVKRVRYF